MIAEEYINFVISSAVPRAMTLDQIKNVTKADITLQMVVSLIKSGDWRSVADNAQLRPYFNVHNELAVNTEHDILLRQSRIVLPANP